MPIAVSAIVYIAASIMKLMLFLTKDSMTVPSDSVPKCICKSLMINNKQRIVEART